MDARWRTSPPSWPKESDVESMGTRQEGRSGPGESSDKVIGSHKVTQGTTLIRIKVGRIERALN